MDFELKLILKLISLLTLSKGDIWSLNSSRIPLAIGRQRKSPARLPHPVELLGISPQPHDSFISTPDCPPWLKSKLNNVPVSNSLGSQYHRPTLTAYHNPRPIDLLLGLPYCPTWLKRQLHIWRLTELLSQTPFPYDTHAFYSTGSEIDFQHPGGVGFTSGAPPLPVLGHTYSSNLEYPTDLYSNLEYPTDLYSSQLERYPSNLNGPIHLEQYGDLGLPIGLGNILNLRPQHLTRYSPPTDLGHRTKIAYPKELINLAQPTNIEHLLDLKNHHGYNPPIDMGHGTNLAYPKDQENSENPVDIEHFLDLRNHHGTNSPMGQKHPYSLGGPINRPIDSEYSTGVKSVVDLELGVPKGVIDPNELNLGAALGQLIGQNYYGTAKTRPTQGLVNYRKPLGIHRDAVPSVSSATSLGWFDKKGSSSTYDEKSSER